MLRIFLHSLALLAAISVTVGFPDEAEARARFGSRFRTRGSRSGCSSSRAKSSYSARVTNAPERPAAHTLTVPGKTTIDGSPGSRSGSSTSSRDASDAPPKTAARDGPEAAQEEVRSSPVRRPHVYDPLMRSSSQGSTTHQGSSSGAIGARETSSDSGQSHLTFPAASLQPESKLPVMIWVPDMRSRSAEKTDLSPAGKESLERLTRRLGEGGGAVTISVAPSASGFLSDLRRFIHESPTDVLVVLGPSWTRPLEMGSREVLEIGEISKTTAAHRKHVVLIGLDGKSIGGAEATPAPSVGLGSEETAKVLESLRKELALASAKDARGSADALVRAIQAISERMGFRAQVVDAPFVAERAAGEQAPVLVFTAPSGTESPAAR